VLVEQANPEANLRSLTGHHVVDAVADEERSVGTAS
jgi:hypothetical protein